VLLSADRTCRLSAIGRDPFVQHSLQPSSTAFTISPPVKWMAPESVRRKHFDMHTDIWSVAVAMWEVFTMAAVPFCGLTVEKMLEDLDRGVRLERPESMSSKLYSALLLCWEREPAKRPVSRAGDVAFFTCLEFTHAPLSRSTTC
jgi:serine/threonine protein kinase